MVDSQQTRILPDELRMTVSLAPGTILRERYRLDSELGRGGMGTVYRATDLELRREVAVKILSATSQTSDGRERLVREARSRGAQSPAHRYDPRRRRSKRVSLSRDGAGEWPASL